MSLKTLLLISSVVWLSPLAALETSHCTDVSEWGPVRFIVYYDVVCVSLNQFLFSFNGVCVFLNVACVFLNVSFIYSQCFFVSHSKR